MGLVGDLKERQVGNISQHDSERSPHLPHHDQTSTDSRRSAFGSVNGYSSGLGTNTESKEEPCDEEMFP